MGCWNKTCAISQFPLVAGDKTVNFVLVQSGWGSVDNHPCYTTGHGWKLIPIPFYGEYNDYGWQEDDAGQQAKYDFLAEHFKDDIIENEAEKERAKTCYSNLKNPFANCESLGDTIHGNVWLLKNGLGRWENNPKTRKMAGFMISRIVWDNLTAKTLSTYPKRKWYTREQIAKGIAGYIAYAKEQKALADKVVNNPDATTEEKLAAFRMDITRNFGPNMVAAEYIDKKFGESTYGNHTAHAVRWCGQKDYGESDGMEFPAADALLAGATTPEDVASTYLLISAMNSLRKTFQPMSHEGSQSGIDHNHHLLLKAMKDMIKLDKIRYGDYE